MTFALIRRAVLMVLGLAGLCTALTWVFLASRSVMAIGGSCASGGPYVIGVTCPEGIPGLMLGGIFGGLASLLVYAIFVLPAGPRLALFAWPALFLSLGWNFLEFGLNPGENGDPVGWLICAVLFLLMGGLPLLALRRGSVWRNVFWADRQPAGPAQGPAATGPRLLGAKTALRAAGALQRASARKPAQARVEAVIPPDTGPGVDDPGDLADALERMARLHHDGALTDEEFRRAKARLLDEAGA